MLALRQLRYYINTTAARRRSNQLESKMSATQLQATCEESATTAISASIGCPVTTTEAQRLNELWAYYYSAALAYYGGK